MSRSKLLGYAGLIAVLAILLAAWELFASEQSTFFFSKPSEIWAALGVALSSGVGVQDFWASLEATVLGLLIGAAIGVATGLLVLSLPGIRFGARGLVAILSALPILAIAPMFLIWFGTDLALKVALAALLASLIFADQTIGFSEEVDPLLLEMTRANRFPQRAIVRKILIPYGVRFVLARFPAAANAAFLGVFIGEFIAADRGIGYRILRAGRLYQVDDVLANALLAIGLLLGLQVLVWSLRHLLTRAVERASVHPAVRTTSVWRSMTSQGE